MNEEEFVRMKYLDFLFAEADRLKEQGMSERESMKMVLQTAFDTTVYAWKESYGARKMAEHFYRMADEFVAISNEEKVK
jgi:1,2-phenylacetyl-CoA epoxidase PaaB subunit